MYTQSTLDTQRSVYCVRHYHKLASKILVGPESWTSLTSYSVHLSH